MRTFWHSSIITVLFCMAIGSSCSYVDSTIEPDSGAIIDMSLASVACRKKTGDWPLDAVALDTFARNEGLGFRVNRFKEIRFAKTNDVLFVEYIVVGGMTKGRTRVSLEESN